MEKKIIKRETITFYYLFEGDKDVKLLCFAVFRHTSLKDGF